MVLDKTEIRVLGSLVEKELTTPDYYPMSLNSLKNACNQKTNRNPLMDIEESIVLQTLTGLREKGLVIFSTGQGQRVTKYRHELSTVLGLDKREISLLASLFLRGEQTLGELRLHTQRMYEFTDLDEVRKFLERLIEREDPLVMLQPRQAGHKENRYIHLLGEMEQVQEKTTRSIEETREDEIAQMKEQIEELQREITGLREEFEQLKNELGE